MNKIFIVLLFILLGSSLIVLLNIKGTTDNSFHIFYENNKNLAMPNLTNATDMGIGKYRLYNDNGITIDYNGNNGEYTINGTQTNDILVNIIPIISENGKTYTSSYIYVSGTGFITTNWFLPNQNLNSASLSYANNEVTVVSQGQTMIRFYSGQIDRVFENFTFKLQLEKGSTATSYIVPRTYPIYKDNLTLKEKQEIGMGAFGGIPQIIRSVNHIIKPITDFFNGLISWFN